MSNKWTFSPSSMPYLERCIAAAPPPDPNNKWFQKFGKKDPVESDNEKAERTNPERSHSSADEENVLISYEDFFDTIESESTMPVQYIMQECAKKPELIPKMAEKLSANTVGQLFKHIFSENDVQTSFSVFITNFLPAFIKLQYSRTCIDLMVELSEKYPQIFKTLLEMLINDTDIPNQVLNNYITMLNTEAVTDFIKTLSTIVISTEGFSHNVIVIYTAYKDCIKTDHVQNYVQKLLIQHGRHCASDRNFGWAEPQVIIRKLAATPDSKSQDGYSEPW